MNNEFTNLSTYIKLTIDDDATLNARYAISIARKIGATIFLLPEDIVEVRPRLVSLNK